MRPWVLVQILVLVIASIRAQQAGGAPDRQLFGADAESLGHFIEGEQALFPQPSEIGVHGVVSVW
jgi:hypothetical protein